MSGSTYSTLVFFFILTLIAEILGTIGGFGSSLFFVSFAQFIYDFKAVLALTGLLHVFSNISKLYLFRKTIDWKLVLWLGISSVAFVLPGAWLTSVIEFRYAKIVLGLFLILISILLLLRPEIKMRPIIRNSVLSGAVSGFLAGFIGTGGTIRGVALAAFHLEKNLFVGTSAMIDMGVDLARTIVYLDLNYLDSRLLINTPVMLIAAVLGSYLGKVILNRIKQETFQRLVLGLTFLAGCSVLLDDFLQH